MFTSPFTWNRVCVSIPISPANICCTCKFLFFFITCSVLRDLASAEIRPFSLETFLTRFRLRLILFRPAFVRFCVRMVASHFSHPHVGTFLRLPFASAFLWIARSHIRLLISEDIAKVRTKKIPIQEKSELGMKLGKLGMLLGMATVFPLQVVPSISRLVSPV